MDGLLYAAISNNMAEGIGSFWKPYLSASVLTEFYEHPPLAFWLQSLWLKVFGDSIYVERFYSLFTYFISGTLLVLIWKQLGQSVKTGWLPLFFWLIITNIGWACANNMLENTMTVFVLLSAWVCIKAIQKNNITYFILSGVFLSLALLTKGFVSLYIWIFPVAWFLIFKSHPFLIVFRNSIILVLSTVLPIIILFFASDDAAHNMASYFEIQVVRSVTSVAVVDTRFSIFFELFQNSLPPLSIVVLILLFSIKKSTFREKISQNRKLIYFLSIVVFCGIAPIMITLKQRGFYILTVYPFVGIILGLVAIPFLEKKFNSYSNNSKFKNLTKVLSVVMLIGSVVFASFQFNKIGREQNEVKDTYKVIELVGRNAKINICPSEYGKFSKHGYYARYGRISLSRKYNQDWDYFLVHKNECIPDLENYELLPIKLETHDLYKKK